MNEINNYLARVEENRVIVSGNARAEVLCDISIVGQNQNAIARRIAAGWNAVIGVPDEFIVEPEKAKRALVDATEECAKHVRLVEAALIIMRGIEGSIKNNASMDKVAAIMQAAIEIFTEEMEAQKMDVGGGKTIIRTMRAVRSESLKDMGDMHPANCASCANHATNVDGTSACQAHKHEDIDDIRMAWDPDKIGNPREFCFPLAYDPAALQLCNRFTTKH